MSEDAHALAGTKPATSSRFIRLSAVAAALLFALLPWWHNRHYQRDLYDYGVTMAGVGRVMGGERPYTDFGSPLQSAQFLSNAAIEWMTGPSYLNLTWGGALAIALSLVLFTAAFARRWPFGAALLLGTALSVATAAQHLIIYFNALGGICLVLAATAAAAAPVLQRRTLSWHLLLGGALWLGGMTKLNWHLVALTLATAWPVRAALKEKASRRAAAGLLALIVLSGVVLPVATELAWTGASLPTWYYNVVANPLHGDRAGDLHAVLTPGFYLHPPHDFYGRLPVSQFGLLGVIACLAVTGVAVHRAWRQRDRVDLVLAPLAGLLVLLAGISLMATNYDIAVLTFGPWLGLLAALWIGFDLPVRGWTARLGLFWPALLLAVAWPVAWQGLRSQFGHSPAPRSTYLAAEEAGPEFAYLRGTKLPPEVVDSMRTLAAWWRANPAAAPSLFPLTGLEWLERCLPAPHVPHRPLWMHFGTSYGKAEWEEFFAALKRGAPHSRFIVPRAYDSWPEPMKQEFRVNYLRYEWGAVYILYDRITTPGISHRPVEFLHQQGGNLDSRFLATTMTPGRAPSGQPFIGITRGEGVMTMLVPSHQLKATAVLASSAPVTQPLKAHFTARFLRAGQEPVTCWETDAELQPGESEKRLEANIASAGLPVEFRVRFLAEPPSGTAAGWSNPSIQQASAAVRPPPLRPTAVAPVMLDENALAALCGPGWRPDSAVAYGGELRGSDYLLAPDGELWLQVSRSTPGLDGIVAVAKRDGVLPQLPSLYAGFYKGGRLDPQVERPLDAATGRHAFRVWSAEPDGWIVIAMQAFGATSPVVVRLNTPP